MKFNRRRNLIAIVATCVLTVLAGCATQSAAPAPAPATPGQPTPAPAPVNLQYRMGGGPSGGIFGVFGGAVSDIAQKAVPGLTMTAVASQGSAENTIRTSQGEFHFAMAGNDAAYLGYNGATGFPGKMQDFRVVMGGHKAYAHMMLPGDSPISSWADLKGKKIALTSPTSPNYTWAAGVLAHFGMQQTDYAPQWINSGQYVDAMKNGTVDAASLQVGYPGPAPQELCTTRAGIKLLAVPPDAVAAVAKTMPFFSPDVIPANVYSCIKEDVPTLASTTLLIANKDVPDDVVYAVVKRLVEEAELGQVHNAGKAWVLKGALIGASGLPIHPGAEKYFREKGELK